MDSLLSSDSDAIYSSSPRMSKLLSLKSWKKRLAPTHFACSIWSNVGSNPNLCNYNTTTINNVQFQIVEANMFFKP